MVTYHISDPSWSGTGLSKNIANAGGKTGAWLSDIMLYLFGYMAYVFPLLLIAAAWMSFYRTQLEDISHRRWLTVVRTLGIILTLLSGSSLVHIFIKPSAQHLPYSSAGGVIGKLLATQMLHVFNSAGSVIILLATFLCGATLFNGISWLKISEWIGEQIFAAGLFLWQQFFGSKNIEEEEDDEDAEDEYELKKSFKKTTPKNRSEPKLIESSAPREVNISAPVIMSSKKIETPSRSNYYEAEGDDALPPLALLDMPEKNIGNNFTTQQLEAMSREVELRLYDFGIEVKVVAVHPGPVVTRFELQLAAGTKVNRISNLVKDLARSLSVPSVRVVEVIPGKSVIGLELPNANREIVRLREIVSSQQYDNARSNVTLALGKDISGHPVIVDLAKMPHLLVAGTTGSGKSVCLNALLLSLLYKSTPKDLRLILIDPKMLELSIYQDIPHLLVPVVTDMKEAANALRWCVAEMDRRYRLMASLGVRNLAGYNSKVREAIKKGAPLLDPLQPSESEEEPSELQEMPCIVVLADEFADMMMVVGKKIEELIARIAQKARAAGIHLVLATQRPSVDVITGLIKANIPTRIAFQVSSKIDSRTILDQSGAEQLLGHGDMLYLAPGTGVPVRVHGAFVSDEEVHRVVGDLKHRGKPDYVNEILETSEAENFGEASSENDAEKDALYDQAVKIVLETRRASISSIQRRLKIGYNRAARIVEAMEEAGLVSGMDHSGSREVLVPDRQEA